ncbi:MAG: TerC family protein [Bacteroidota bacterium]
MTVWIIFLVAISIFLALDLGVFNKNPHIISSKEASKWTILWVTLSFIFSGVVYLLYSGNHIANPTKLEPLEASIKFITGYLIELSLSADNIFVIAIIFASFKIPQKFQHRVLFWGIIGAIVFRGLMIFLGVALINRFEWIIYVFGAFLIFTAMKMLFTKEEEEFDPKDSKIYKIIGKIFPVHPEIEDQNFFIKKDGTRFVTPLFIALIVIEVMDVIFALDSVPAILAITSDPFLVFSSNIFAILGLRSMYFFLANMIEKFSYIEYSLIAILTFVGIKMLLIHHFPQFFPEWLSLAFIALSITLGVVVSLQKNKNK